MTAPAPSPWLGRCWGGLGTGLRLGRSPFVRPVHVNPVRHRTQLGETTRLAPRLTDADRN